MSIKSNSIPHIRESIQASGVQEFGTLVQQGIDAWTRAGELLVKLIESDPFVTSRIRKEFPQISAQTLIGFEKIGRKIVYAPLLADTSLASRALLELPYSDQCKYFHSPIETVVSVKGGKPTTKMKKVDEMSRDEVRMVFGRGCIRPIDEQVIRFKELESFEIQKEKPRPAFVDYKVIEVGYYVITLNTDGEPKIAKAPASMPNATSIRLMPYPGGEKSAVVLFYREPRNPLP